MDYFSRLNDLVYGWGYSEEEAREMLQDNENEIEFHDFGYNGNEEEYISEED